MTTSTRTRLLAEANHFIRTIGYSAFSYNDLSKVVGITKASIHHHFPTKEILVQQVLKEGKSGTKELFVNIEEKSQNNSDILHLYVDIFESSFISSQLPLCCALSSEIAILPEKIKSQVSEFIEIQIDWLEKIITAGESEKEFTLKESARSLALSLICLCEGASIVARGTNNTTPFASARNFITTLMNAH